MLKYIIHVCTLCSYQILPPAGTDSPILRCAVYKVLLCRHWLAHFALCGLQSHGVLIYEGLTLLHAILRLVDRDLSEYHMKNLTAQECSFTVSAERETALVMKGNCATLVEVTTQCSNRLSKRRPASSQKGTSSLSTFSRAVVVFTPAKFQRLRSRGSTTLPFPYHEVLYANVVLSVAQQVPVVLRAWLRQRRPWLHPHRIFKCLLHQSKSTCAKVFSGQIWM